MSFRRSALLSTLAAFAAAVPAATMSVAPAVAHAQARDASAEAFVAQAGQRALHILNDGAIPVAAKKAQFRQFVNDAADVGKITRFVLGRYARTVSPAQMGAFTSAFREYADNVYESRLSEYRGEGFKVTGSQARTPNDVVVASEVVGGAEGRHDMVSWRVQRGSDGRWRVVDVNVQGVWLAITEQQDFVSTLDNNRGDINVLIGQLRRRADAPPAR